MHPDFATAVTMLAMPRLDKLSEAQAEGTRCVWCGGLAPVALGPRLSTCRGALVRWTPHSCRRCARREAGRVYDLHIGSCQRCMGRGYCPDARALYKLSQPESAPVGGGP